MKSIFLKVFLRNFSRHKWLLLSSILSLAISIACCMVAYLNYDYTHSFDDQHLKKEKIFKVNLTRQTQNGTHPYGVTPSALGPYLKNDIAGIAHMSRFIANEFPLKCEDRLLQRNVAFIDPDFLDMFTFPLFTGEKEALSKNAIFLTQETASALFDDADPIGKTVHITNSRGKKVLFRVTGVLVSVPFNSTTQFDVLLSFENYDVLHPGNHDQWRQFVGGTFLELNEPKKADQIERLMQAYVAPHNQSADHWQIVDFWMEPLSEVPYSQREIRGAWLAKANPPSATLAPIIMAILILLNACFNYSNTAIAISNSRLKEIGVKKVLGLERKKTIQQFFYENFLIAAFSLIIGVLIAYWLAPAYSNLWPYINLEVNLFSNRTLAVFLMTVLVLSVLLGGAYPAFYVSKFRPSSILSEHMKLNRSSTVSRALLSFQFVVTMLSLIAGVTFVENARYQSRLDQGYEKKNLIVIPLNDAGNFFPLKNQVLQNPDILKVTATNHHIASSYTRARVNFRNTTTQVHLFNIGVDYLQTVGLQVTEGRGFSRDTYQSDRVDAVVINEKLAASLQEKSPIGQKIFLDGKNPYRIIGVVRDFYTNGLWSPVEPTALRIAPNHSINHMVLRVMESRADLINGWIGEQWGKMFPEQLYQGFVHEARLMADSSVLNQNIIKIFAFLSFIALLISSLGLYSLISLDLIARKKEIGMRKVLGVSLKQLSATLNKPFMIVLSIAFLLGSIVSTYAVPLFLDSIWIHNVGLSVTGFFVPIVLVFAIFLIITLVKIHQAFERKAIDALIDP